MTRIYLSPPHMLGGERELLLDAFDSNWIAPLGPHVTGFEAEIAERAGVGHAAALSSGTGGFISRSSSSVWVLETGSSSPR